MLDEFVNYVQKLFPSISPYVKNQTEQAIRQFKLTGRTLNLLNDKPYDYLTQGDILSNVPFIKTEKNGEISAQRAFGMLLSNTCSADHDDDIVIAPLLQIKDLGLNKNDIVNNLHYRLFYLPDKRFEELVVDFSLMNTFNKNLLNSQIEDGKVKKVSSLNQMGFYLLLSKLTVCFMRPEDEEVQANRRKNYIMQHEGAK